MPRSSVKPHLHSHAATILTLIGMCTAAALGCKTTTRSAFDSENEAGVVSLAAIEQLADQAGTNQTEIMALATTLPDTQREGLAFLLENMPKIDQATLDPELLKENISQAYAAFEVAPWRKRVPKDIFLNDILPYACVNETRENWRPLLREKCAALIAGCQTPSEAARQLNEKLFKLVNVRYSTQRKKPDQSPMESMASGVATCTGLSILLVDACRAVGVPARLAGTPLWTNLRGNHTWVEIWDDGWHFTGAAEPDAKGLNRGWFKADASRAIKDQPRHAIYATSFKKTGLAFPLVWATNVDWVPAINVTDRYTATETTAHRVDKPRLLVKALNEPNGKRVAAQVKVAPMTKSGSSASGSTRDESADLNDLLSFVVEPATSYRVTATYQDREVERTIKPGPTNETLLVISFDARPTAPKKFPPTSPVKPAKALSSAARRKLARALTAYFTAPTNLQSNHKFERSAEKLLRENEDAVRKVAWESYLHAPLHEELRRDFDKLQVRFEKYLSPYTVRAVGTRPTNGWALFIAMHGGGGAPKQLNDSQWVQMQKYYRDHPEAGGYLYVALRAPNDTWNGFYDTYVYPLVSELTRQFRLFGDIDPNKVFIMGYSHGGYGAFAIGPKMPDHFAAIHASAAAPTDGETTPVTLRNTIFTCMVGEKDTMYGRFERNQKFAAAIEKLRGERSDTYPVRIDIIPNQGHGGLPDRDQIKSMYPAVRNPVPRELDWLMTDKVIKDFFWLRTTTPGKQRSFAAVCRSNEVTITTSPNLSSAAVLLDSRLIDFHQLVVINVNGKTSSQRLTPSLRTLCETIQRRADPDLAFVAEVQLDLTRP